MMQGRLSVLLALSHPPLTVCIHCIFSVDIAVIVEIAAGENHNCIRSSHRLLCWGYNFHGQLGTGFSTNQYSPTAVAIDHVGAKRERWSVRRGGFAESCITT